MTDTDPYARMGWATRQLRSKRFRTQHGLLLFVAVTLTLWGLWASGVIFSGPVPLPLTDVEAPSATENWALPGRDAAHTSYAPVTSHIQGDIAWRFETESTLGTAPAVVRGKIFLVATDDRLVALDAQMGELLWERHLPAITSAPPTVTDDLVYLTLRNGQVIALDTLAGGTRWTFDSSNVISTPAVIHQGVMYAVTWGGTVHALDAVDGRELWTFQTEGRIVAAPAFSANLMAVATDDGLVYVVDTIDAGKRLIYEAGFIVLESPVFAGDRLLVSTAKGRIAGIDQSKIEYSFERGFRYWRQQLFLWNLQEHPPIPKGHVWGRKLAGDIALSAAAVSGGIAFVASADGQVHAMEVNDGRQLWTYDAGVAIRTSPTVVADRVYVGTHNGDLLALNVTDGTMVQRIQLGAPLEGPIIVTEEALYVTSQDPGVLFAVR